MPIKPCSPLFQKKSALLPLPGEGVGGIDLGTKETFMEDQDYVMHQHHADPGYDMPFGQKGTEFESIKHGAKKQHPDSSVCVCGHQWHEHWHQSDFGCKSEGHGCECGGFKARKAAADQPTEPSYRAAQILAQLGQIKQLEINRVALEIDRILARRSEGARGEVKYAADWKGNLPGDARKALDKGTNYRSDCLGYTIKGTVKGYEVWDGDRRMTPTLEDLPAAEAWCKKHSLEVSKQGSQAQTAATDEEVERFREDLKEGGPGLHGYMYRGEVYCPACGLDLIDQLINNGVIGPPSSPDPGNWVEDPDIVPQPIFFTEPGSETCSNCGEEINPQIASPKPTPSHELTEEDKAYLREMNILGSTESLVKQVTPVNPLFKEPDPETATFFKESEPVEKRATEKSYGMGTPLGGASSVPAPNNTQEESMDPLQKPTNPWMPPEPPKANTAPQQVGDQVAQEVVKQLQEKMSAQAVSKVDIHEDPDLLPPRTDLMKHLDETLVDKDNLPPRPLSKGANVTMDAETWWRKTDPDRRREKAGALGIEPYWTSFVWGSLDPQTREKVIQNFQRAMEPPLDLTEEDKRLLGEMNIQAARESEWDSNLAKKLYDEGCALAKAGNWGEAAESFRKSLTHHPYYGPARFMLGIALAQDGNDVEALPELKKSLGEKNQQGEFPFHRMIVELEREGDLESLSPAVKGFLHDRMMAKETTTASVQIEEGVNQVCPNCHGKETKPVDDPEAEDGNLVECMTCGAFFAK